ncbi:hypothetical protein [Chthonomonas calidirosea]|uniref:hypothetical protein n=1 Tax=Chthonomonas calidirosea TaxID=454171 RepID=UPI0006EC7AA8|nr:hypothetical protein [Chthonomonas calidirosea]CEK12496.1 hypothetical protein CP488_00056 [Chthonomonas calidirosea]
MESPPPLSSFNIPPAYPYPPSVGPPRRSTGTNCLLWTLGGCGVLVLLMVLGGIFATKKVGHQFQGLFQSIGAAPVCEQKLLEIRTGLQLYAKDHGGKFPPNLQVLVPNYLPDTTSFTYRPSDNDPPRTVFYKPPAPNAPGDTVVARFWLGTFHISDMQKQSIYLDLLKDGTIVEDQFVRQYLPERQIPGETPSRPHR